MDQDDRLFVSQGTIRFGLYDDRPESPTHKMLNIFTVSERNRALIVIPRRVYHGLQNVGNTEAVFINMPSRPYNHVDPDKYRLPLKNDLIPFAFDDDIGW
jgi:dTDP-4-dehydrorhamnose 3,5-epimerase